MCDLIFVIDLDVKRRAAITFYLNSQGFRAEPFEDIGEFMFAVAREGLVLVHDEAGIVESLIYESALRQSMIPVIAYSHDPDPSRIVEAVLKGALGYAAWPSYGDGLVCAIRRTLSRIEPNRATGTRRTSAIGRINGLTSREKEVLSGMADGLSNRQIAHALLLSPRTVELHRANLLEKIGAKSSAEAIRLAIEASLPAFDPRLTPAAA